MLAVRQLRQRAATPGPRRTSSAKQLSISGTPRSLAQASLAEHAEEGEHEVGLLSTVKPARRQKLRPDMKRFFLFVALRGFFR